MKKLCIWLAGGITLLVLVTAAAALILAGAANDLIFALGTLLATTLAPLWISAIFAFALRPTRAHRVLLATILLYATGLAVATTMTFINPDPQAGMAFILLPILFSPIAIAFWLWAVLIDHRSEVSAHAA